MAAQLTGTRGTGVGAGSRPPARARFGWIRRHLVLTGVLVVAAVLVVVGVSGGLGGGSGGGAKSSTSSGADLGSGSSSATGAASSAGGSPAAPAARAARGASATGRGSAATGAPGAATAAVPGLSSRVIKTGSLTLQVPAGRLVTIMGRLGGEATGLGGFVASSTTATATPGTPSTGDVTVRVPVQSFDTILADVEHLGRATSVSTSGQDVTSQYVDLQARIQALRAERTQFGQILTRAQSIGDILAVEQQITTVQTQLEQLQGQLKVLTDQSSDATLAVHVVEALPAGTPTPRPATGLSEAAHHAWHSFTHGLESILAFSGGLAVFLLVVGILALIARIAWGLSHRRPRPPVPGPTEVSGT